MTFTLFHSLPIMSSALVLFEVLCILFEYIGQWLDDKPVSALERYESRHWWVFTQCNLSRDWCYRSRYRNNRATTRRTGGGGVLQWITATPRCLILICPPRGGVLLSVAYQFYVVLIWMQCMLRGITWSHFPDTLSCF